MKFGEGNCAFTLGPANTNLRFERGERDAHVGGMSCDAQIARAENCVNAIHSADGAASASGIRLLH